MRLGGGQGIVGNLRQPTEPSFIHSQTNSNIMIFLIAPLLAAAIPALISAFGSVGGAALTRGASRRAIDRQNEYNTPVNQLSRLREAGLPYAAMTDAISGNQSVPQESESGLGEGVRDGINQYIVTRAQQKQFELLDAQIRKEKALGEVAWKDAWIKDSDARLKEEETNYQLSIMKDDTYLDPNSSNLIKTRTRERQIQVLNKVATELSNELARVEKHLKNMSIAEMSKRIEGIIYNNALLMQTFRDNDLMKDFDRKLALAIREQGDQGLNLKETVWTVLRKFLR